MVIKALDRTEQPITELLDKCLKDVGSVSDMFIWCEDILLSCHENDDYDYDVVADQVIRYLKAYYKKFGIDRHVKKETNKRYMEEIAERAAKTETLMVLQYLYKIDPKLPLEKLSIIASVHNSKKVFEWLFWELNGAEISKSENSTIIVSSFAKSQLEDVWGDPCIIVSRTHC